MSVLEENVTIDSNFGSKEAPYYPGGGILGHLGMMKGDVLKFFLEVQEKHGEIARLRFATQKVFFVFHPRYIKHILVDNASNYSKKTRGYEKLRLFLGNGLVTNEGDSWRRQRRIVQPAFRRSKVEGFFETMRDSTLALSEHWDELLGKGEPNIDIAAAMMKLTLGIAGETLFSCDISGDSDELGRSLSFVLDRFNHLVSSPLPYPEYFPTINNYKLFSALRSLDKIVYRIIREHREADEEKNDLLTMLMHSKDPDTGKNMTDLQLRDEVQTMLQAGHETTANALSWTFFLLSKHPDVLRKVEDELERVLEGRIPEMSDLRKLTYLTQVFKESMRLYPPIWALARYTENDDRMNGYRIPKGSLIFLSSYAVHRNPEFWDNPEGFDPERFSEEVEKRKQGGFEKFSYFPFSVGQRKCIGDYFAQMEAVTVLSILLSRYRLELASNQKIVADANITLRPKNGIKVCLKRL